MTISRINTSSWSSGDKLTAAQMNSVDLNGTYAFDIRAGQVASVASLATCTGAGRIISSFAAGPDANTSFTADGGNTLIGVSTLTANRTYTLLSTNAQAGDVISIANYNTSFSITVKDQSSVSMTALLNAPVSSTNLAQFWSADFEWSGTAWIMKRVGPNARVVPIPFTSGGTLTVPFGVYALAVAGCGNGGAGGGGGASAGASSTASVTGGGGGGAAPYSMQMLQSSPGTVLTAAGFAASTAGNAGVASGGSGGAGGNGASITFGSLVFPGGGGGAGGVTSTNNSFAPGGPTCPVVSPFFNATSTTAGISIQQSLATHAPGDGGFSAQFGSTTQASANGAISVTGFAGGTAGIVGTPSGSGLSGAGGGGGGGGPFGVGGNGGTGGQGNTGGPGTSGTAGTAAAANTGAGGGGGGGAGTSSTAAGVNGSAGGAGGTGYLIALPIR